MKMNLLFLLTLLFIDTTDHIINFGTTGNASNWSIVNDGVMGGLSQSTAVAKENYVVFSGSTSLKNNGGFASYRSPYKNEDLSSFKEVEIRFKSTTSRQFYFQLDCYRAWWYPNYKHAFYSDSQEWTVVKMPLKDFKEFKVGAQTGKKISQSQLKEVLRLGIILLDKKEGPFQLEIDYIKFI